MKNKLGIALLVLTLVVGYPLRALAAADALYLPNLGGNATGTLQGAQRLLDVNIAASPGSGAVDSGSVYTPGDKGVFNLGLSNESASTLGAADGEYLPMTVDSTGRLRVDATITEAATAADGGALPGVVKVIGGYDGSAVRSIKTDATGAVEVNVASSALPTDAATETTLLNLDSSAASIDGKIIAADTDNVTVVASALPADAATETTLSAINTKTPALVTGRVPVDGSGVTQPISAASLPLPTGAATAAKQPALGTAGTASADVITVQGVASMTPILVNGSGVTQPVSGTVTVTQATGTNLHTVVDSSALPTGAATETTVSALNSKVTNDFGASSGAVRTASQIGNATGAAAFAAGNSSAQTLRVVVATDQAAIATKAPVSSTGSGTAGTVSTVITLTAPANATGFILMNLDTSTANVRWAIGRTATTTVGQQLQPGRDTGFVPCGANVSIVAESGTQNYDIQWVSQ